MTATSMTAMREYRITASSGTAVTKNGILAGQYIQPVGEWIQPELAVPGLEPSPMTTVASPTSHRALEQMRMETSGAS